MNIIFVFILFIILIDFNTGLCHRGCGCDLDEWCFGVGRREL